MSARQADNNGLTNNGAAFVFKEDSNGQWELEVTLTASNAANHDNFGRSVAISGDTVSAAIDSWD